MQYRRAFFVIVGINVLAFGFEMTNLTIHHDDLAHMFAPPELLNYYLGRFSVGWLHRYIQNGYIMPFLQLTEGILIMTVYGLIIANFWGLRRTLDVVLISAVVTVFPYMAQIYQYNTNMAIYPVAYLACALAVVLSIRATPTRVAAAALLYTFAFSIYQSVIANSAVIMAFWLLAQVVYQDQKNDGKALVLGKSVLSAVTAVVIGGLLYVFVVSLLGIEFDSYQGADRAFTLSDGINVTAAAKGITEGTRSFFMWPEHYFPNYLKKLQLVYMVLALVVCIWVSDGPVRKIAAIAIIVLAIIAARTLQIVHPEGTYHALTLTAYAVVVAGFIMVIHKSGNTLLRNVSIVAGFIMVAGYVMQSNWISTVNYLNTLAHYSTMTQILAGIKSLPRERWNGEMVVVVGSYRMPSDYPFKQATGVASQYIDASHLHSLARLMRERIEFISDADATPKIREYAANHAAWPNPESIGGVDGVGVIVLSKDEFNRGAER